MDTSNLNSPSGENLPSSGPSPVADLERSVASLRAVVVAALAILLIGSIGLNFILVRQVGASRRQAEELAKRVQPLSAQYDNTLKPRISAFLNALVGFARTNPDFLPILQKYPIAAAPGSPQPAAPAPVPVAPAPK